MANDLADIDGAISIKQFSKRNGVCERTVYNEIYDGRLIARKCRGRTLIALSDEKAWRDALPKMQPARAV